MSKRIVMWLPGLAEHGGIARHNRSLCKAVASYARARDVSVDVVSLRDPDKFFDPTFLTQPLVGCAAGTVRFGLAALASLRPGFDLLVVGVVDFGPLVPFARIRRPGASILTITHGIEVWNPLSLQMRIALAQASSVMSVSAYTADAVARQHGVERSRIHVVPPPLDPGFLAAAEGNEVREAPRRGLRLLSISRLNEIDAPKGVDRVIEALPLVRSRVPDVDYTVIGTGDDRDRLERLAESVGVQDITHFAGAVSDSELHEYLSDADLFVLPSAKEGFGIVFLEAAVHEMAVIGGNHGGIPEVVINGETGVLVKATDLQSLAHAIVELLLDDGRRIAMGRNGARRARESYSYERFEQRIANALDGLLESASTRTQAAGIAP